MVQYWRPSCSSWAESVRSSFGRTIMGKAIWETPIETRLGKSFQLGMLICTPWKKDYSYLSMWMTSTWLERNKILIRCGKYLIMKWFVRTNIIPWSCTPGMYSKQCEIMQRYCRQLQNHVWIQNFRRSNRNITMLGKSEYLFVVLKHGRSCQEMCGTILWVGKQNDSTTLQSINSLHWRPSFQRRRISIRGIVVKSML